MRTFSLLWSFTALLSAECAWAHRYQLGAIMITHPVIEAARKGESTCARMTLRNSGPQADRVLAVRVGEAADTEIRHRTSEGSFQPIRVGIPLPPNVEVRLQRPEWCILLRQLASDLEPDFGIYPAVLLLERAGEVQIEFLVAAPHPHVHH
jgi:copper(I)-binding protein